MASIFAKRMKNALNEIIDETQCGFMKRRHISSNIRLVIDLVQHSNLLNGDPLILFLDFRKAFDTVSHKFIFDSFGFRQYFIKSVRTMYCGSNSSIKLANGTSPRFEINRGIRQGCPISAFLFLVVAQVLSNMINQHSFKGIAVNERQIKILQLADDTTIFLSDSSEVPLALNIINNFSKFSQLKNNNLSTVCNIPVKSMVNYLGIKISKNTDAMVNSNFIPVIEKMQKRYNSWLARDLSIQGRILLSKAEGLSRAAYLLSSLSAPKAICSQMDKILFNFIWRNKPHEIKKGVLINKLSDGGLNVLNSTIFNQILKIYWLKNFLKNQTSIFNIVPYYLFEKLGGLNFLLQCPYITGKLPIVLANYHKQAVLY
uniref:Reverse transcriptase domain-containing protein n=1 Tax=Cyprinus carpio TaxID=7962 RepID=A0A8C1T8V9_CYPCA